MLWMIKHSIEHHILTVNPLSISSDSLDSLELLVKSSFILALLTYLPDLLSRMYWYNHDLILIRFHIDAFSVYPSLYSDASLAEQLVHSSKSLVLSYKIINFTPATDEDQTSTLEPSSRALWTAQPPGRLRPRDGRVTSVPSPVDERRKSACYPRNNIRWWWPSLEYRLWPISSCSGYGSHSQTAIPLPLQIV